jgi:1-acyl-sn-glycerol-3-phosphate acyltransferase
MTQASTMVPTPLPTLASEQTNESRRMRSLDLLELGKGLLTPTEERLIRIVRKTFEPGPIDQGVRLLQRHIGARWIETCIRNVRNVHGLSRLPKLDPSKSYIVVSNHRSFFDLYVITAFLVYRDLLPHRILFPVRSKFFYDNPLGLAVNGLMSFFAMYPPVFRERHRAALNLATLDEVSRILRQGGAFVGLHPEGKRNIGSDPYALLPAKFGIGRVIYGSRATVLPVFINGLGNDLVQQARGNFDGTGADVNLMFGAPVEFGAMLGERGNQGLFRRISERALADVKKLAEEERKLARVFRA